MIITAAFDSLATTAFPLIVGAAVGIMTGLCYFGALWWNISFLERGMAPRAIFLFLLRFTVLAAVFGGLAKIGALALLAGAGGLLAARHLLLRGSGKLQ